MEKLLLGAGCPGGRPDVRVGSDVRALWAGCPGSESGDEKDEHFVGRLNPGEISEEFVEGNWVKGGGKLDLSATHEIRGSNPTKLHHTNKSQKKLGRGAIFRLGRKTTKSS